ncbi:MAG: bifunctional riboflavin kinase/FAD synthetase [Campylobacterota bacterium]|nr:bifunctional riboflavin kinase/FAD synthetase [Campylobacterota bacterium]
MVLYQTNLKGIVIKKSITSIAIGGFDGMHLAHQQLFLHLDKNSGIVVIQTQYANLTPNYKRKEHTNHEIFFYPLEDIKHLNGVEFLDLLVEEFPRLEKIVVGYDFHFGHKALNDTDDLKNIFKGEVVVVEEFKKDDISIHSRVIRENIRDGDIKKANSLLGYNYKIEGLRVAGQGLGSKQFVPTVNIEVEDFLLPKDGIYVTKTIINNKIFNSVTFIGHRVTTDGKFAVETHIIDEDFCEDISYKISIIFLKKIRDNMKFKIYDDLKKQILKDIDDAKSWFIVN